MERPMLHTLEPELLRSFVAIAEGGSFTAAARRVHRTQSAVSMQIKRLEEQLGRELFRRDSRAVTLTPDGETLLGHARRILRAHQEALAAFDREALAGEVAIGAPDDYASTFLPRILARFGETHPRVQVNVVCRPSVDLLGCLAEGSVDMALVTQGSGEAGGVVVHREPLAWITSAGHRAHEQDPLPLAVFHHGCCFRRAAVERLIRVGRPARIAYTSMSVAGIYAALDAGLAVSVLLRSNLRPGLRALAEAEGFPPLPEVGVTVQRSAAARAGAEVLDRLERHIVDFFRGEAAVPALGIAA
jgi:DNA-binding transcriptional LysR family regulator